MSRHLKGLLLATLVLAGHVLADVSSTSSVSSTSTTAASTSTARPRAAKTTKASSTTTPSTTTVSRATHPPYPYDSRGNPTKAPAKYPYADMINQYDPSQVTGNPIPRSTYAPYIYGSDPEPARKKHLLSPLSAIDRDTVVGWARDVVAYLAAPFLIPSAITNAFNTPPGLPEQSSLWGKIARSFRAAWFRRSEDRDGSETLPGSSPADQIAQKLVQAMKNRIRTSKIWEQIKNRKNKGSQVAEEDKEKEKEKEKDIDKKVAEEPNKDLKKKATRLLPARLLDLFRMKRHRTSENNAATAALETLTAKSD